MASRRYPLIAREAWPLLGASVVLALLVFKFAGTMAGLLTLSLVFALSYLFRDPQRRVPAVPLGIVSPCEGTVLSTGAAPDPWLERDALRIRLRMSWLDPYSLFSPTEGKVMKHWCKGADAERSWFRWGTRHTVWLQTDEGDDVVLSVAVTHSLGKLRFYFNPGERIGQGQRCGFLFFGGRAELFLPRTTFAECEAGQDVAAANEILAKLSRASASAASA
jgi:phosphatidylserine decarboxylase